MKLLYVTDSVAVCGGIEKVLTSKANSFVEQLGYEISILTTNQGRHSIPFPLNSSVNFINLDINFQTQYQYGKLLRWKHLCNLRGIFRKKVEDVLSAVSPDIIICLRIDYISDIVKVKGQIPLIYESHSSFWASRFERDRLLRQIHTLWMNLTTRQVQAVVALTNGDGSVWHKITNSVYVIPNVVNLNLQNTYSNCLSKSVIFVGRLCTQKGVDLLMAIWSQVYHRHPDWQLHIYGDKGNIGNKLYHKLLCNNIGITLYPSNEDIIERYKEHSFLLMTSLFEPFGLVLPEAMSCGLPVVSFDCPYGPAEIIIDGVDGFLIKDCNLNSFVGRVCQLIEDRELRIRMGQAAIKSSQRYRADLIMPKWKGLFEELCQKE